MARRVRVHVSKQCQSGVIADAPLNEQATFSEDFELCTCGFPGRKKWYDFSLSDREKLSNKFQMIGMIYGIDFSPIQLGFGKSTLPIRIRDLRPRLRRTETSKAREFFSPPFRDGGRKFQLEITEK